MACRRRGLLQKRGVVFRNRESLRDAPFLPPAAAWTREAQQKGSGVYSNYETCQSTRFTDNKQAQNRPPSVTPESSTTDSHYTAILRRRAGVKSALLAVLPPQGRGTCRQGGFFTHVRCDRQYSRMAEASHCSVECELHNSTAEDRYYVAIALPSLMPAATSAITGDSPRFPTGILPINARLAVRGGSKKIPCDTDSQKMMAHHPSPLLGRSHLGMQTLRGCARVRWREKRPGLRAETAVEWQ